MQDSLKEIPIAWYAAVIAPVIGWGRTMYKAGQTIGSVNTKLEAISTGLVDLKLDVENNCERNNKHFDKLYTEIGDLNKRVAEMKGQLK